MTRKALIIIDVQNDYFKDGRFPLIQPELALDNILKLEKYFKENNQLIVYVQHVDFSKDAAFFEHDTPGVEIREEFDINDDSVIVQKQTPNSFFNTNLQDILDQHHIEEMVISGMMTHLCVDSTTRTSKELGYSTTLVKDATATRDLEYDDSTVKAQDVQHAFISALANFSTVVSTEEYLK